MTELFKEGKNEAGFLKCGILGFSGTGKTFTSTSIAIGLQEFIKSKKPIYFIDSETGSDFVLPRFKEAKIELRVAKTRAFKDLLSGVQEAEQNGSILIIDSISHFWNELMQSYKEAHKLSRLTIRHWIELKPIWREFTELYLTSKLHIIMCGRATWEWGMEEDEEGIEELKKIGTKMQVEKDLGYEPSLLIEIEQIKKRKGQEYKIGQPYLYRAWIVKDRFNLINAKFFDMPTFENFLPHIEALNIGGEHKAIEKRDSKDMFKDNGSKYMKQKKKEILLEEIKNEFFMAFPSTSAADKKKRIGLSRQLFGTDSWAKIEMMKLEELENGLKQIRKIIEEKIDEETK